MLELLCIDFLINTLLNTSKLIVLNSFFVRFLMSILEKMLRKALRKTDAPLAQLVEQLTLNQWVRSSSLRRCTIVGVTIAQGPPVPIPNTEVKLCGAEDT